MSAALPCKTKPSGVDLPANMEVDGIKIRYGAKAQ